MLFSRHFAPSTLTVLCRMMKHSLGAGLNIATVFRQQSKRGPSPLRPVAVRVAQQLESGNTLTSALQKEPAFPPLFLALVEVGEESGHLTEVFGALEEYYQLQEQMRRRFRTGILLPAIQFFIAVVVIAIVIWILGMLSRSRGAGPGGVLGLSGAAGALTFAGVMLGGVLLVVVGGQFLLQKLRGKQLVDGLILHLPVVGSCAQALAMARFTLAMHLTLESGMLLPRAIRLSLQATGNAAFEAQAGPIVADLKKGEDLTLAFAAARVFPTDFRHIMAVAEESGRVPEAMRQQCRHYQEEGERKVKGLMAAATGLVWLIYAVFVIIMIFQLASVYFGALPQ